MPLVTDVRDFAIAEYDRAMGGLEGLFGDEEAEAKQEAERLRVVRGDRHVVRIPRWDDVVTITPRPPVSGADRREFFRARREGRAADLPEDVQREIERRRGIATAIRDAAQPKYSQDFGAILTAIDNVQDFMSTVATAFRVTYWTARVTLPQVAKRLIPGIGWVLGVADLLNLLAFFGLIALPAFAVICFGTRDSLAAALPAMLFGRRLKALAGGFHGFNPFSRRARLKRRLRIARRLPGIGAAIEVGQTFDQFYGTGLSFGALVGAIIGAAYGLERGARGEPVQLRTPPEAGRLRALLADRNRARSLRDLQERSRAAAIVMEAPMLLSQPEIIGQELWIETLVAYSAALALISDDLRGLVWQDLVGDNGAAGLTRPAPVPPWDPGLRADGQDLDARDERWAVPGVPHSLTESDLLTLGAITAPRALRELLEPIRATELGMFVGATVDKITNQLYLLFEADPDLLAYELVPDWRVLESLLESNRLVNINDPPDAIWAFWGAATEAVTGTPEGRRSLTADELDSLAADAGLQLIRTRALTATPETLAPP